MHRFRFYIIGLLLIFVLGCSQKTVMPPLSTSAPVIVYRTKADYTKYVPVRLSEDGRRIVAYPSPDDIVYGNQYRYPVALRDGYYWDQQGVGGNTAFLSITYAEYANLKEAPSPEVLIENILDKKPFLEIYHAGKVHDYRQVDSELNEVIKQKRLQQFSSLLQGEQ